MRQWGALVGLLLAVLVPDAMALVVERPCCASMTHVSGEFTDVMALAETPVAATELVPVTPFHACEPLAQGVDLTDRIALVQRGECNFVKKVYHAQLAGAVGVVVMDSAARAEPPYHIIMQKDENASLVSIPAVFVKYEDGEGLLRRVQTAPPWRPVLVTLSDVGELVPQDKSSYRVVKRVIAYIFLVSAVCALSSGLSIVSSFVFNAIGRTWRTRVTKKLPLMSYRPLLQQELLEHAVRDLNVIDRIVFDDPDDPPVSVIDSVHSESLDPSLPRPADAEACSICLDDFDTGDRVKVLPCQHFFHVGCIDPWLERRSGRCPLCKMDAIAATDEAPKSIFGLSLPRLEQILRQEHWFHTFFLMLPASLVSCLIVNTAASIMRNMWP